MPGGRLPAVAAILASVVVAACAAPPSPGPPQRGAAGPCPPKPAPELPPDAGRQDPIPRETLSQTGVSMAPNMLIMAVERLERVEAGMQAMRSAPDTGTARREARGILDQLVGPGGRHTSPTALQPGLLPAAQATLTDPGIVLTAYGTSQDPRLSQALADTILGNVDRWQEPAKRWTEIDEAVAAWTPTTNTMQRLDGGAMRLVGWSLLALQTQDTTCAHEFGANGLVDAVVALRTAREALFIACTWAEVICA